MKIDLGQTRKARIEMLPLIDIVFLLLVFFIYAMLSMAVHMGLPVTLPFSDAVKIDERLVLSVTVKADGSLYVDKQPVTLENLSSVLKKRAASAPQPGVLVFGDRSVSYQRIFQVLDKIKMAGITRVSLQAELEKQMQ